MMLKSFYVYAYKLTIEFAQGMNIPKVNIPKTGPPTIPNIPRAA